MFKSWRFFLWVILSVLVVALSFGFYIYQSLESYRYVLKMRDHIHEVIFLNESKAKQTNSFLINAYGNKDLYIKKKDKYTDTLSALHASMQKKLELIKSDSKKAENMIHPDSIQALLDLHYNNKSVFEELVQLYIKKGFKDYGVEGQMRQAIHKLESLDDNVSKVYLLTLRRHEKDFLLRKDEGYLKKFDETYTSYQTYLNSVKQVQKAEYLQNLDLYKTNFFSLVNLERQIGYTDFMGLRSQLHSSEKQMQLGLTLCLIDIGTHHDKIETQVQWIAICVFGLFICIAVSISLVRWYYLIQIEKPIKQLQLTAKLISNGRLQIPEFTAAKNTIFESVSNNLTLIISKLKDTMQKMEEIVENKYEVNKTNAYDEVEILLQKVNKKIRHNEGIMKKYLLSNEGLTKLNDVLRMYESDENLDFKYLSVLSKHIQAVQSCVYSVDHAIQKLFVTAAYAGNKEKLKHTMFSFDECLPGSCALTSEIQMYQNVTDDFYTFSSGLGNSVAPYLICVPGKYQDKCIVVIEIATLYALDQIELEFVSKAADVLAFSKMSKKSNTTVEDIYYKYQEGI